MAKLGCIVLLAVVVIYVTGVLRNNTSYYVAAVSLDRNWIAILNNGNL